MHFRLWQLTRMCCCVSFVYYNMWYKEGTTSCCVMHNRWLWEKRVTIAAAVSINSSTLCFFCASCWVAWSYFSCLHDAGKAQQRRRPSWRCMLVSGAHLVRIQDTNEDNSSKMNAEKARRTLPCDKIHSQRKEVTKIPPFSTETTPFSSLKAPALAPQATYKRKFCARLAKLHLLQPRRIAEALRPRASASQAMRSN